ncbi:hypothetical protein FMK14_28915, partial [Klebsiella pneumoniae]|nr:hypothetical protein [Klebsiella pneumoniae]
HQARNSSRRGNKIPFRRRIDSSKPTYRQNRCCKNGSDHRFRFLRRPQVEDGQLTVQRPGQKTTQTLAVGAGVFDGIKIGHGWVESPGRSVSETATVFAS